MIMIIEFTIDHHRSQMTWFPIRFQLSSLFLLLIFISSFRFFDYTSSFILSLRSLTRFGSRLTSGITFCSFTAFSYCFFFHYFLSVPWFASKKTPFCSIDRSFLLVEVSIKKGLQTSIHSGCSYCSWEMEAKASELLFLLSSDSTIILLLTFFCPHLSHSPLCKCELYTCLMSLDS